MIRLSRGGLLAWSPAIDGGDRSPRNVTRDFVTRRKSERKEGARAARIIPVVRLFAASDRHRRIDERNYTLRVSRAPARDKRSSPIGEDLSLSLFLDRRRFAESGGWKGRDRRSSIDVNGNNDLRRNAMDPEINSREYVFITRVNRFKVPLEKSPRT